MAKSLRSGAVRMLVSHAGVRGHQFRTQYAALQARFGPFDGIGLQYASSAAALFVEWLNAQHDLDQARRQRERGLGRRPSVAAIRSLQKRAGLAWGNYDASLRRLEELTRATQHTSDPLETLLNGVDSTLKGKANG
jgi:hypothetical protein